MLPCNFHFNDIYNIRRKIYIPPQKINDLINIIDGYSYTLYLVHGIVFCSLIDRLRTKSFNMPITVIGIIAIIGTFVTTIFIHKYFELPVQNYLKNYLNNYRNINYFYI